MPQQKLPFELFQEVADMCVTNLEGFKTSCLCVAILVRNWPPELQTVGVTLTLLDTADTYSR